MSIFPKFDSHREAACWSCGTVLTGEASESGYPPGHGAFVKRCLRCGKHTWYDLKTETTEKETKT